MLWKLSVKNAVVKESVLQIQKYYVNFRQSPNYGAQTKQQQLPLEEKRSGDAKVTYLTEYELSQPNNSAEYLQHERLTALKSTSLPPEMINRNKGALSTYVVDGGHTTDSSTTSERIGISGPIRSEDELSGSKQTNES